MADFSAVRGGTAYDNDGDKIGGIDEVYTDKDTGEPTFVTVHMGLFGTKTTFVPLADATVQGNDLRVPYTKAHVKDAPNIDPDMDISDEEQERLYRHYGLSGASGYASGTTGTTGTHSEYETIGTGTTGTTSGVTGTTGTTGTHDDDLTTGRAGVAAHGGRGVEDDAMTRSEERLRVGTRTEEVGRARLRKYVVTERQTANVQVAHEELRVEREPITAGNRGEAYDGPGISEAVHEVTLHAERPVVEKEVVPVERIRLDTETVVDTETVSADVRKEQVELDAPETAVRRDHDVDRDRNRGV
jgi:uncharacterized protein (TIGR02271 family)